MGRFRVPSPAVTSSEKRQRHKDGHRSRMEEARIAAIQARRRNGIIRVAVGLVSVVVVAGAVFLLLQEDPPDDTTADGSTTTVEETLPDDGATTEPAGTPVELPPGPAGETLTGPTECPPEEGAEERVAEFAEAPPECIDPVTSYEADIAIVQGEGDSAEPLGTVTIALDTEAAPQTVNNFVVLSRYRFYDGIPFHRLVPGFVAQVGGAGTPPLDAEGQPIPDGAPDYGSTGPGYSGVDEEYPTDGYAEGDVAMARAAEVSGSQFFIVTGSDSLSALDQSGNYPRFGRVTAGLELAQEMTQNSAGEQPTVLYTIESITIREV